MDGRHSEAGRQASLQGILGYLNFSEGRPDARFQMALDEAHEDLVTQGVARPREVLRDWLAVELAAVKGTGGAFRDAAQAEAVLSLVFVHLLPAYRRFHNDLVAHQTDDALFTPFFLARAVEAVLAEGGPWGDTERIVSGAVRQLNDYVGHRPVALLETRPRGEPYDHERVRPVPLSIRGAGVGAGPYRTLIAQTLDVLSATDPALLDEAGFSLDALEELAFDPRAYDFDHPVNRRPNYLFGEWDPHRIDGRGRYCRYVARQITLDALLERVASPGGLDPTEAATEAAVVCAGTLLMATATSGAGPGSIDSATTLAVLTPRIAQLRDSFYQQTLHRIGDTGPHGARLRQEAVTLRQPFGGARQHLNATMARRRATQAQHRRLALLYASMGYPEAGREEAARIAAVSVRLVSELQGQITTAERHLLAGRPAEAARGLPELEALLRRAIECGAVVDPWNILGFQGLFPIAQAREDAVRDLRVHDLVALVERMFGLAAAISSEAASRGETELVPQVLGGMKRLAVWWDRFASTTVNDVHPVLGSEAAASAEQVAVALARWHERGHAPADLGFWKRHLAGFRSPKAFAVVVEVLLRRGDLRAAQGLLISWLSQAEQAPLEDGAHSFHTLVGQWLDRLTLAARQADRALNADEWNLLRRLFEQLEANAEDYWQVPSLDPPPAETEAPPEEDVFGAAYEGMTYEDSTDDREGAVADGGPPRDHFALEEDARGLLERLRFHSLLGRLWAAAASRQVNEEVAYRPVLVRWAATACANRQSLHSLLDLVHTLPVPDPVGGFEALVEYDRRRAVKDEVVSALLTTSVDVELALGALRAAVGSETTEAESAPWARQATVLDEALLRRDVSAVRSALPGFLRAFQEEPLHFVSLADGGEPRLMLRARLAVATLRRLVTALPGLGLLRETYHLVRSARGMEKARSPKGKGVTEFDSLCSKGLRGVVECLVRSAATWRPEESDDESLVDMLNFVVTSFLALWTDHSRTLRISSLDHFHSEAEWAPVRDFVRRYGRDLFDVKFLALANLRGLLSRGAGAYLDDLRDNADPSRTVRLLDEIGVALTRDEAARRLEVVVRAVAENYDEYKDFNATSAHSDYGDNLYLLLEFLRLKASYDRHAWAYRPLVIAHDVLTRAGRDGAAVRWQEDFTTLTREAAAAHLEALAALEAQHRIRLGSVAERIGERFVRPLELERVCALVRPALAEADQEATDRPAFERLRREIDALAAAPGGPGLDVPAWIRRLEATVVQAGHDREAPATESDRSLVDLEEVERQLAEWETPPL